ncbi:MAG TPA: STAS domain-containing protein [Candidatus Bathyarchaeia archaeon]|nr:STAS domain-containing protein [Candidatus Bathyarchaeia archaeon]
METLIGVLVTPTAAERAIGELLRIPVPQEAITFLTTNPPPAAGTKGGDALAGACLGGIFAGTAGLSLGTAAATLLVPGVGPVLAIGVGAAAVLGLGGAGAGAALGGSVAPGTREQQAGAPCSSSADAEFFRDVLQKGRSLIIVRTESKKIAEAACAVLDRLGVGTRRADEAPTSADGVKPVVRQVNGVAIVDLSGRITLGEGSARLRDTVQELIGQGHTKIMLNLRRVTHIDSSGIGELMRALTTMRSNSGELKLVNISQPVNEILKITRLIAIFDIVADETSGLSSFRASA